MKKLYTRSILAFCIFVGLSSITHAGPPKGPPATQADLIAVKEWRLSHLGEKAVAADAGITLVFNDKGQMSGSGGVNSYGGEYEIKAAGQMTVKNIFATEKAALDEDAMKQEGHFFQLLGTAKRAILSAEFLVLECEDKDKKLVTLFFAAVKKE